MSDELTTYKRADGEPIADFSFVCDIEYFEDEEEPIEIVQEVWRLVERHTFWVGNNCWVCREPVDFPDGYNDGPVLHNKCIAEWEGEES